MTHYEQQGAEGVLMGCLFAAAVLAVVAFLLGVGVGFVIRVVIGQVNTDEMHMERLR